MIEWMEYNHNDHSIDFRLPHLITDGENITVAYRSNKLGHGYAWYKWASDTGYDQVVSMSFVTHYAVINLPGEEEA